MPSIRSIVLSGLPVLATLARSQRSAENSLERLRDTFNTLPRESVPAVLQDAPKYREGIFEDHEKALEAVHSDDPTLASKLVEDAVLEIQRLDLRKRQDNNATTSAAPPPSTTPEGQSSTVVVITSTSASEGQSTTVVVETSTSVTAVTAVPTSSNEDLETDSTTTTDEPSSTEDTPTPEDTSTAQDPTTVEASSTTEATTTAEDSSTAEDDSTTVVATPTSDDSDSTPTDQSPTVSSTQGMICATENTALTFASIPALPNATNHSSNL